MKSKTILDATAVNPLAQFARRTLGIAVKRIRGLTPHECGVWVFTESTNPKGLWYTHVERTIRSRDVITVEDAEQTRAERIARNAARFAGSRAAEILADRLAALGVGCSSVGGRVVIIPHGVESMNRLLDTLETRDA